MSGEDDVIIFIFILILMIFLSIPFSVFAFSGSVCDLSSLTFIFTVLGTLNAKHLYCECFARKISLLLWIFSFRFIRQSLPDSCLSVEFGTRTAPSTGGAPFSFLFCKVSQFQCLTSLILD